MVATLISVNLGVPHVDPHNPVNRTGIDKRPVDGPVQVRAPGPARGSGGGLAGDHVLDGRHHGGDDQAVYAYAREDLDHWAAELGRRLDGGVFGDNLTTSGLDVTGAVIGERWRIGERLVLQVTKPRIPCGTFARWMEEEGWIKRFTATVRPGTYLSVVTPGPAEAGDPIEVVHRPEHGVTIGLAFRALTTEPELLPRLLLADELPEDTRIKVTRRLATQPS